MYRPHNFRYFMPENNRIASSMSYEKYFHILAVRNAVAWTISDCFIKVREQIENCLTTLSAVLIRLCLYLLLLYDFWSQTTGPFFKLWLNVFELRVLFESIFHSGELCHALAKAIDYHKVCWEICFHRFGLQINHWNRH